VVKPEKHLQLSYTRQHLFPVPAFSKT